ncbi:hypothetical protein [Nocardia farcinica]|nr:hypothetical protein [Nocardia farcinica]
MSERIAMARHRSGLIEFADHEPGRLDQHAPVRAVGDVLTP